MMPTPTARDYKNVGTRESFDRRSLSHAQPLTEVAVHLLPTPTVSDTNGPGAHGDGGKDLRTTVTLLPTPAVNDMGAGKTVEDWDAWTDRMKAAHGNGNGHGKSLAIEAQRLLPTPCVAGGGKAIPEDVEWSGKAAYKPDGTKVQVHLDRIDLLLKQTGDSTPPPSTDGPQSWDVPLPLQLSPEPRDSPDFPPASSSS